MTSQQETAPLRPAVERPDGYSAGLKWLSYAAHEAYPTLVDSVVIAFAAVTNERLPLSRRRSATVARSRRSIHLDVT
jgi:hypothetical protein